MGAAAAGSASVRGSRDAQGLVSREGQVGLRHRIGGRRSKCIVLLGRGRGDIDKRVSLEGGMQMLEAVERAVAAAALKHIVSRKELS